MYKVRRKIIKAAPANLKLPANVLEDVGRIIGASIIDNIDKQQQADGSALKENAPSTKKRKLALGQGMRSLIAEKLRFVKGSQGSWKFTVSRQSVSVEPATGELKSLVRYVQQKGYTGWFGINKAGMAAAKERIAIWIRARFKGQA